MTIKKTLISVYELWGSSVQYLPTAAQSAVPQHLCSLSCVCSRTKQGSIQNKLLLHYIVKILHNYPLFNSTGWCIFSSSSTCLSLKNILTSRKDRRVTTLFLEKESRDKKQRAGN